MVKKLSKTGVGLAASFAVFAVWSVISTFNGEWQATEVIFYVTLPVSLAVHFLFSPFQSLLGLTYGVLNWIELTLDITWGILVFYFFGWLLERPFR